MTMTPMWRRAVGAVARGAGPTSRRAVSAAGIDMRAGFPMRPLSAQPPFAAVGRPLSGSALKMAPSDEGEPTEPLPPTQPFLDRVVNKLNESIKKYPGDTLAVLFASDIGSIGAMYGLLSLSGASSLRWRLPSSGSLTNDMCTQALSSRQSSRWLSPPADPFGAFACRLTWP